MSRKIKEEVIIQSVEEQVTPCLNDMFSGRNLLKDGSNLNIKLNKENHYFQHIHRLSPESKHPFYYIVNYDGIQYKGGPYKDIYEANRACANKLYELYNLDEVIIIECEKIKSKELQVETI